MRHFRVLLAVALSAAVAGPVAAQTDTPAFLLVQMQPTTPPAVPLPPSVGGLPLPPSLLGPQPPAAATPARSDAGSLARARIAPHMIGDLASRGFAIRTLAPATGNAPPRRIAAPVAGGGAFKIAENESPRPVDRVFITYNYFNGVHTFGDKNFDLHREVFGFEKTLFGGDASFGVRLPVLQRSGGEGGNFIDGFGDLSLIFKVAAINDEETGDVLSGGLVLTVPTGRDIHLGNGDTLNGAFLQPWLGFIANAGRVYVQGFSSVVIPTESRDVTFLSNDLGVGYRLYQADGDALVSLIAPTLEGHLFTPLSNRGDEDKLRAWDSFTVTAGVHIGLRNRAFFTLGVGVPLVGPRPNDFEAIAQFNWRF